MSNITNLKTNYDARTNNSDVEKINNRRKQTSFEDETSNMQMAKEDIQGSSLNCKYLSIILALKIIFIL